VEPGARRRRPGVADRPPSRRVRQRLDVALTVEPGALWFRRGSDTAPTTSCRPTPSRGGCTCAFRADALERNLLELPHRGWAAGQTSSLRGAPAGSRGGCRRRGSRREGATGSPRASTPSPPSRRPRPLGAAPARRLAPRRAGSDLDRFSAFRSRRLDLGDFETLSRVVLRAPASTSSPLRATRSPTSSTGTRRSSSSTSSCAGPSPGRTSRTRWTASR